MSKHGCADCIDLTCRFRKQVDIDISSSLRHDLPEGHSYKLETHEI